MAAKKGKRHERSHARESAVALLYSSDITEQNVGEIVEDGAWPAEEIEFPEYAESLVMGVAEHLDDIDARLATATENWSVDRMPVVDRAVLRLAVYEMIYVDDVPVSVAINEAVDLAKAYGGEDESSRFVNGVLGRIARTLEGENAAAPAATSAQEVAAAVDALADAIAAEGEAAAVEASASDEPASEEAGSVEAPAADGAALDEAASDDAPAPESAPDHVS